MQAPKRATVYFERQLYEALRLKAVASNRSVSETVNDAVKAALTEDEEDLAAFEERKSEKSISIEAFVRGLKRRRDP